MTRRSILLCALAGGLGLAALGFAALVHATSSLSLALEATEDGRPQLLPDCADFTIRTDGSAYDSLAELARTREEKALGMMYRTDLPDWSAMLFDMGGATRVVFWMKNTPSSLDIAFFDTDGRLAHLESGAVPFSTDYVGPAPEVAVSHVLEVPAGQAAEIGLVPGVSTIEISEPFDCPRDFP